MQTTRGFVMCECGEVLQYIKKTMRFTVCLQQTSKFAGICSTSYTARTTEIVDSLGFWRFWGLESETGLRLEVYSRSCAFTV